MADLPDRESIAAYIERKAGAADARRSHPQFGGEYAEHAALFRALASDVRARLDVEDDAQPPAAA